MARVAEKKKIKNGIEYFFDKVCIGNDVQGRKKYKDIYAKTAADLKAKRKKLERLVDEGIKVNDKQTFDEFFKKWLFTVRFNGLKPSSKERYESLYRNYIKNSPIANIRLNKINSLIIQEYYNQLVYETGKSPSTLKSINKIMKPCLKYAYNQGFILRDYGQALNIPEYRGTIDGKDNYQVFTLEEQQSFIKGLEEHRLKALFLTALATGLRQGELLALTWNDIDLENNYINVNKSVKRVTEIDRLGQKGKSKFIIQTPKTKTSIRKVPIPKNLVNEIQNHKKRQDIEKDNALYLYTDNNLIFCTDSGTIIDSRNVLRQFKKILRNSNISDKKFHSLRHTYATRLFELEVPIKTVQDLLGHSSMEQTMNIYTHVMEDVKISAVDKINNLF